MKTVCWLSGGVSSFIAAYLIKDEVDEVIYIDIEDQHYDTRRFIDDCVKVLGIPLTVLKSEYGSVETVARAFGFVNSPHGAKCSQTLKKRVRQEWERKQTEPLCYVWGYDCGEQHRADRIREAEPDCQHRFPLIEQMFSKEDAHGLLRRLGIARPIMYDLGYQNNNCIGCVKGGMGYWNKIRRDFPVIFRERAKMERDIGASCITDVFLDELDPARGREDEAILDDCGILCELAYREVEGCNE